MWVCVCVGGGGRDTVLQRQNELCSDKTDSRFSFCFLFFSFSVFFFFLHRNMFAAAKDRSTEALTPRVVSAGTMPDERQFCQCQVNFVPAKLHLFLFFFFFFCSCKSKVAAANCTTAAALDWRQQPPVIRRLHVLLALSGALNRKA